jgi:membrane protein YdbS with pleckstrin-like domain
VQRVGWWILALVVPPGLALTLGLGPLQGTAQHWLLGVVTPVSIAGLVLLGTAWTRLQYRHARWRLTRDSLEIRRGVVWRRALQVPRSRVQHTDVVQGPVQRRYGIATLAVHTAGTSHATVTLDGLSREDALAVRDRLLEGEGDDL